MNTLELLITRRSEKKLSEPAPNKQQLDYIFEAALHAPDHGKLNPYHFVVIEKDSLKKFKSLLEDAVCELNLGDDHLKKAQNLAYRAPMVIGVIAKRNPNINKVPMWEQELSAACATYAMQLAAKTQGFDNIWITGKWVEGTKLRKAFDCEEQDKIIALLFIGSAEEKLEREKKAIDIKPFVSYL